MDRGREGVVRRLGSIDVIIRMHWGMAAQRFAALAGDEVADHLVHVHVRLGSTARLPDAERELVVVLAAGDGFGGLRDRAGPGWIENLHFGVDHGTGLFDPGQRMDQFSRHPLITDREIPEGPLGLGAPERFCRNTDRPQAVFLLSNPIIHRRMPPQTLNRMQPG